MPANKGQIDVALGEKFLADHWDTYEGKDDRNFRGLCGHGDQSPTPEPAWGEPAYAPMGAVTAQAADSTMAKEMTLQARAGPSLRRRLYRRHVPERASRICLAEADSARHERQSLDRIQSGRQTIGCKSKILQLACCNTHLLMLGLLQFAHLSLQRQISGGQLA